MHISLINIPVHQAELYKHMVKMVNNIQFHGVQTIKGTTAADSL